MASAALLSSLYGDLFGQATVTNTGDGALLLQSAPARYAAWALAFPAILIISRWCWKRQIGGNFAPGFFFASFLIPVLVIPAIACESVSVTPERLTIRTGVWFAPTVHDLPLTGIQRIVERQGSTKSRRLKQMQETYWDFYRASGRARSLDLPDLLEANRAAVADYLRGHGMIVDAPQPSLR